MMQHAWVPSTLGHGETMCSRCFITNREAAALGMLNDCERNTPEEASGTAREAPSTIRDGADRAVGPQAAPPSPPLSTPSPEEAMLPCPFCGGVAETSMGQHGDGSPWRYIECATCAASAEPDTWNRRAALSACPSGTEVARDVWRHLKRGTTYHVVHTAEVQSKDLEEGELVEVYHSATHPDEWHVRRRSEYYDGRFAKDGTKAVAAPPELAHAMRQERERAIEEMVALIPKYVMDAYGARALAEAYRRLARGERRK